MPIADPTHPPPAVESIDSGDPGLARWLAWFASRGWSPFDFQLRTWAAYRNGFSGLVHAPTGSGKTLSVFGGPAIERLASLIAPPISSLTSRKAPSKSSPKKTRHLTDPFTVLWLTPLRALANDTAHTLSMTARQLELPWSVELRTSDTSSAVRKRQQDRLPTVLITTPESLSLQLSYPAGRERMSSLRCAIVDEWHELMSTKRGVQAELGLARLRRWNPAMRVWGLSATLGNLPQAMEVLCPRGAYPRPLSDSSLPVPRTSASSVEPERVRVRANSDEVSKAVAHEEPSPPPSPGVPGEGAMLLATAREGAILIHANIEKDLRISTILPESAERFPWAGHLGIKMVQPVIAALDQPGSALVFCNTRSHTEHWFKQITTLRPDWLGQIAIHHGSMDRKIRIEVEGLLREGRLRAVVCTSSLDLGVDFSAVDRVIQIGSPKGIGRLMQRAGRSGHRPGEPSIALCVPTHAFELIEFSAAREGIERKQIEARPPLRKPLDVLVQHVVTIAAGGGFETQELLDEVRTSYAYAELTDEEWGWVLDFVERGGPTLTAYPRFARVRRDETGRWVVVSPQFAKLHRYSIGTIVSDGMIALVTSHGRKLGAMEESFISRLKPGDAFIFAGRNLELIGIHQMTARVRPAKGKSGVIAQWMGAKFPMSTHLADRVRFRLGEIRDGIFVDEETRKIAPLMELQARWSAIPAADQLLIESIQTREGGHHFLFPFLGRLVHEGLAAVIAHRLHNLHDVPVVATLTDYGIELHSPAPIPIDADGWRVLLSPDRLIETLLECLNAGELTKRQFREIARIAGLIVISQPGQARTNRQLQASSELFYDVFREFDPQNLLLEQARREVLEQQLEINRLKVALEQLGRQNLLLKSPRRLTPMAFPLWAQRIGSQTVRVENAHQRIDRMLRRLEAAAVDDDSQDTDD